MNFIDVNTLEIHNFFNDEIPPYAILLRSWNENEMTFQEMSMVHSARVDPGKVRHTQIRSKRGHEKIMNFVDQRKQRGLGWV
jgi:hypothetical protein